jgi:hypothetical protein
VRHLGQVVMVDNLWITRRRFAAAVVCAFGALLLYPSRSPGVSASHFCGSSLHLNVLQKYDSLHNNPYRKSAACMEIH